MKAATYKAFRSSGSNAVRALRSSKTVAAFREAEAAGLVRLVAEPEEESYFDVYGEPDGYTNGRGRRVTAEQERKKLEEMLERDGCWWVAGQIYRGCPHCGRGEWETVDSVGMCAGYSDPLDPLENCCVPDIMRACLDALEEV